MSKSILYRLFGLRKVPEATRNRFETEDFVFDEEGTSCALAYRKFRGTHKSSGRGWQSGVVGTLVITKRTFYVHLPFMIQCDRPIGEAVQYLELELQGPSKLVMKFEVAKIFEHSSGELTCYWRTENASAIFEYINALQAQRSSS